MMNERRIAHAIGIVVLGMLGCGGAGSGESDNTSNYNYNQNDSYEITGTIYYADAVNGSDENPGTESAPFLTVHHGLARLTGGDALYLFNGDYGDVAWGRTGTEPWEQRPIPEVYTDWVTVRAADGHEPHLESLDLGTWNQPDSGDPLPFTTVGNSDLRMRFDGLVIENGVQIHGSRYVEIRNCRIHLRGDLQERIEDPGVRVFNGQHIKLLYNEITSTGFGISGMTTDFTVRGNEIHHNSHDGISILGGANWLVEYNAIHDLDDGAADGDGQSWNMHVDGIHMYMVNNGDPKWAIGAAGFTFRGNVFYHLESMAVMINANEAGGTYENWLWENNVFGPVGGRLFILGAAFYNGFVFRHNTVVYAPNDTWVSMYGRSMGADSAELDGQWYHVQVWGGEDAFLSDYQFYNNIFTTATSMPDGFGFVANNLYLGDTDAELPNGERVVSILPYVEVPGSIQDFLDSGGVLGQLVEGSPAIDMGSTEGERVPCDRTGNERDDLPDIGAMEH